MTLNEKIQEILFEEGDVDKAANSIEKLMLQSQIDENKSILEMAKLHMDNRAVIVLESRITELTNKLNNL